MCRGILGGSESATGRSLPVSRLAQTMPVGRGPGTGGVLNQASQDPPAGPTPLRRGRPTELACGIDRESGSPILIRFASKAQ